MIGRLVGGPQDGLEVELGLQEQRRSPVVSQLVSPAAMAPVELVVEPLQHSPVELHRAGRKPESGPKLPPLVYDLVGVAGGVATYQWRRPCSA